MSNEHIHDKYHWSQHDVTARVEATRSSIHTLFIWMLCEEMKATRM